MVQRPPRKANNMKQRRNDNKQKQQTSTAQTGKFCSYPQASKMLGVGIATIRNLAKCGTIKSFSFGDGMKKRIVVESIRKLLAEKENV